MKGVPVFYERFRSTVRCSYSVKFDLKYSYGFRQKAFAPAWRDMLSSVENSLNYSSVDSDMASKSFNAYVITLMYSMKARSALFYQGCMKKQLQNFEWMWNKKKSPYKFFPCNFYKRTNQHQEIFWLLVLTLLPHWCKISRLYLVSVPNYWI